MAFAYLEEPRILVSYQDDGATEEHWNRYIDCMTRLKDTVGVRYLVWHTGSPPTPSVQKRISDLERGRGSLVSLISPSLALRFVVSAFSLINRNIRYFPPEQLTEALEHIRCTPLEKSAVRDALRRLQGAL